MIDDAARTYGNSEETAAHTRGEVEINN